MDQLKLARPPAVTAPFQAQMNGESFYWVPKLLPVSDNVTMATRGWHCGDATEFAESVRRVLQRPRCSPEGYLANVWGVWASDTKNRMRIDNAQYGFTVEKTPDFVLWPHIHVAMRSF